MLSILNIFQKKTSENTFQKGRQHTVDALVAWHQKIANEQKELERIFTLDTIDEFTVNVWDDYDADSGDDTYAYVEMRKVPNTVCCDILIHLLGYVRSNTRINSTGVTFQLSLYDSAAFYPILIGDLERPERERGLFKQWQIIIQGASYDALKVIVDELKRAPSFCGKPIKVLSES